jgi:hypothetical protein
VEQNNALARQRRLGRMRRQEGKETKKKNNNAHQAESLLAHTRYLPQFLHRQCITLTASCMVSYAVGPIKQPRHAVWILDFFFLKR